MFNRYLARLKTRSQLLSPSAPIPAHPCPSLPSTLACSRRPPSPYPTDRPARRFSLAGHPGASRGKPARRVAHRAAVVAAPWPSTADAHSLAPSFGGGARRAAQAGQNGPANWGLQGPPTRWDWGSIHLRLAPRDWPCDGSSPEGCQQRGDLGCRT